MNTFAVGDKVQISESTNPIWQGIGRIVDIYTGLHSTLSIKMLTGQRTGMTGGFSPKGIVKLPELKFNIGDRVRVVRAAKSNENDWKNSWVGNMNNAVGQTGTVRTLDAFRKDVGVYVPGVGQWGFPEFVLELVSPKPVWKSDLGYPYADQAAKSEALKQTGIVQAIGSHVKVFKIAQLESLKLGRENRIVHVEMVQDALEKLGYKSTDLGNAAGGIFRSKNWKDTGRTQKSNRATSRRRKITLWEYVGPGLIVGDPITAYNAKIGTRVAVGPGYVVPTDQVRVGKKGTITRHGTGSFPVEVSLDGEVNTGIYNYKELVLA